MLTVFAAVAELEREYILQRQREGIAIAKAQGKYRGRAPQPLPDNFSIVVARWRHGEITAREAMRRTGLKPNTFYRRIASHRSPAPDIHSSISKTVSDANHSLGNSSFALANKLR